MKKGYSTSLYVHQRDYDARPYLKFGITFPKKKPYKGRGGKTPSFHNSQNQPEKKNGCSCAGELGNGEAH